MCRTVMKLVLKGFFKIAPFLYMLAIWVMSSHPDDAVVEFGAWDRIIKESLHLIEFAILYGLFVLFFIVDGTFTPRISVIIAVISSLYGLVDEIHQSFVPSRSATVIDFVKDVTGVLVLYVVMKQTYFKNKTWIAKWLRTFESWFTSK